MVHYSAGSLFLLNICWSGGLAKIIWSVWSQNSQRILYVSFSKTDFGLCIYHLFVLSNFNFFHNCKWIPFSTQSCQVLYSLCANLVHSLITWLIVSSLSPHNLFCFDLFNPYGVVLCCYQKRFWFGGARGVIVIAVGNEHGDTSSNPGPAWLHFT